MSDTERPNSEGQSPRFILESIADALEAASASIRRNLALDATRTLTAQPAFGAGAVDRARGVHASLGPRQAQILEALEEAGLPGASVGSLANTLEYDEPNTYLTLQALVKLGFVEKDHYVSPHIYRLSAQLLDEGEDAMSGIPDSMPDDERKAAAAFHREMIDGSEELARKFGYRPNYFIREVARHGGVAVAKSLLAKPTNSEGFSRLFELDRLDMSVEAVVLKPGYESLFTDEERKIARDRLLACGYDPDQEKIIPST